MSSAPIFFFFPFNLFDGVTNALYNLCIYCFIFKVKIYGNHLCIYERQLIFFLFVQVLVDIEHREIYDITPSVECVGKTPKKRKKVIRTTYFLSNALLRVCQRTMLLILILFQDAPSPIALEPCNGNRAAVLSLLVRLPTGEHSLFKQANGKTIFLEYSFVIIICCRWSESFTIWSIGWISRGKCAGNTWQSSQIIHRPSKRTKK